MLQRLAPLLLLLSSCRGTAFDTGLNYSGLSIVHFKGTPHLCAFTLETLGSQPGYKILWRLTVTPLDPTFIHSWFGDAAFVGPIHVEGTPQGHHVMTFGEWMFDLLPADVTIRQQIGMEGRAHSGDTGIQTVVITGGTDQF